MKQELKWVCAKMPSFEEATMNTKNAMKRSGAILNAERLGNEVIEFVNVFQINHDSVD